MEVFEEWIGNIRISVLVEFHPLPVTNFGSCPITTSLLATQQPQTRQTSHDHSDVRPHASPQALATAVRAARQMRQLELGDTR